MPDEEARRDVAKEARQMRNAMLQAVGARLRGELAQHDAQGLPDTLADLVDELAEAKRMSDLALLVTSDPEEWEAARVVLRECGLRPVCRTDPVAAMRWLELCGDRARLLLVDMRTGGEEDGIEFAGVVRRKWPWIHLAVVTAFPGRWLGASEGVTFLRKPMLPLDVVKQAQEASRRG